MNRSKTQPLRDRVAIVAGATRGAGRGIARGLGEAGAVVYCAGRSVAGHPSPYGRPETIDETAALVNDAGGTGIAARVDFTVEAEVEAFMERVRSEQGHLDVLVSSIAGEDPRMGGWGSFWKTDLIEADAVVRAALLSHIIAAKHAAPLMMKRKRGLIVEVTEHDLPGGAGGNVIAGLVKGALKELAVRFAEELRPHKVAAIAITPGFLRSETMLERFGVTEANWREGGTKDPNFLASESPLFIGRAVAALAAERNVMARSGDLTSSWALAREFGFTDADGTTPDWGRHAAEKVAPAMKWMRDGLERQRDWLLKMAHRANEYLGQAACAV